VLDLKNAIFGNYVNYAEIMIHVVDKKQQALLPLMHLICYFCTMFFFDTVKY
jgi:hypothetical protein